MKVFLDDIEIGELDNNKEVKNYLDALIKEVNQKGRAIVKVLINGIEVVDWDEMVTTCPELVTRIALFSSPMDLTIREILTGARDYILRLIESLEEIATNLQAGYQKEAFSLLAKAVEGLEWYSQVLRLIMQTTPVEAKGAEERIYTINNWLKEILTAAENRDYSLLADLLLYELVPEIKRNAEWLGEVLTRVNLKA